MPRMRWTVDQKNLWSSPVLQEHSYNDSDRFAFVLLSYIIGADIYPAC